MKDDDGPKEPTDEDEQEVPPQRRRQRRRRLRFDHTDRKTRHELIREIVEDYGWVTIPDLAEELIAAGLYTEDQLKEGSIRWVSSDIKAALRWRTKTEDLPFAGPTRDHLWKVRTRWSARDYDYILRHRNKALIDDYDVAVRIRLERIRRYPEEQWGLTVKLHVLVIHAD